MSARSPFVGVRGFISAGAADGGRLEHMLFLGTNKDVLAPMVASLQVRTYRPGEIVVRPGCAVAGLHLVLSGRLCIFDLAMDGHRLIFEYVGVGEFDGLLPLSGLQGHFSEAVEPSRVITLSHELLARIAAADPNIGSNLIRMVSRRLQRREDQLRSLSLRNPSQRLAAHLLAMANSVGTRRGESWVTPRVSHEALADMLGLRRETVTLHMGHLGRMHAVTVDKRCFVLDAERLAGLRDGPSGREDGCQTRSTPQQMTAATHKDGTHSSIHRRPRRLRLLAH